MPRALNKSGDRLVGAPSNLVADSLLDFWTWGFSDLCDDDVKGIFAEWLVHRLLGIRTERRVSWANSDVIAPNGARIEIKSTSYWQSWKLVEENGKERDRPTHPIQDDAKIRFNGLKAKDSTGTRTDSHGKDFKSHIYVFALQKEKDPQRWNAMDLSQWEFYAFPVEELREFASDSVSLMKLRERQRPMSAADLAAHGRELIGKHHVQRSPHGKE